MPDLQTHPEQQSVSALVSGIVGDAQDLLKQQLELFKTELRSDLGKSKEAMASLATGVGVLSVGGLMLCWALAHFVNWYFEWLPQEWKGFALVGGVLTAVGAIFFLVGRAKFNSFNPLPDETAAALQENLEWRTKSK